MPSCSRTLWFLSRDWDTSRTIRSRIQRNVHATKTYSIILLSALISSRQLIERRDERKRNPFVSRACTYPCLLFLSLSLSLPLSSFDSYSQSFRVSGQPISSPTTISGCVKAIGKQVYLSSGQRFRRCCARVPAFFRFFRSPYSHFPNAKERLANFWRNSILFHPRFI